VNEKVGFNLTEKGDESGSQLDLKPEQVLEQVYTAGQQGGNFISALGGTVLYTPLTYMLQKM
jgi:hypothetical protein